jgi:hypothetical protein
VDNHHYSFRALAPRCFWGKLQPTIAKIRQLDPYSDHNRDHTRCITSTWVGVNVLRFRCLLPSPTNGKGWIFLHPRCQPVFSDGLQYHTLPLLI